MASNGSILALLRPPSRHLLPPRPCHHAPRVRVLQAGARAWIARRAAARAAPLGLAGLQEAAQGLTLTLTLTLTPTPTLSNPNSNPTPRLLSAHQVRGGAPCAAWAWSAQSHQRSVVITTPLTLTLTLTLTRILTPTRTLTLTLTLSLALTALRHHRPASARWFPRLPGRWLPPLPGRASRARAAPRRRARRVACSARGY